MTSGISSNNVIQERWGRGQRRNPYLGDHRKRSLHPVISGHALNERGEKSKLARCIFVRGGRGPGSRGGNRHRLRSSKNKRKKRRSCKKALFLGGRVVRQ